MIERTGDLFDTTMPYLAHGANAVGVMGAGVAKRVKEEYPEKFAAYKDLCSRHKPHELVGKVQWCGPGANKPYLVNLFTQDWPGARAEYRWVAGSLLSLATTIKGGVAIPEIGCGIGGLEWPKVEAIVKAVESAYPNVEFEVWHYDK